MEGTGEKPLVSECVVLPFSLLSNLQGLEPGLLPGHRGNKPASPARRRNSRRGEMKKVLISMVMICLLLPQVARAKESRRTHEQLLADMQTHRDFVEKINAAAGVQIECSKAVTAKIPVLAQTPGGFVMMQDAMEACRRNYNDVRIQYDKWLSTLPQPEIAMDTTEAKLTSWGTDYEVHKTTTAHGVDEQWVFRGDRHRSLYFHNGTLATIQE
jgi:hypothetical protein